MASKSKKAEENKAQNEEVRESENVEGNENGVFEMLNPELRRLVKKRFKQPTLPQKMAIKPILEGKNVLLISQTGSGKTESVMLPVLNKILTDQPEPISTLYITPLKALNRDLLDRMIWWANKLELDIAVRHGDTTPYRRRQQVEFPPQLMITTLETLQPILTGKKLRELLKNVKYVILDEVHETVNSKRGIQLAIGLQRLRKLCEGFQLIMLSATVGHPRGVADFFSAGADVEIIKADTTKAFDIKVISPRTRPVDKKLAKQIHTADDTAARIRTIMDMVKDSTSALTFTNTRDFAEILASRIRNIDHEFPVAIHHSSLSKQVRIKTEKNFKDQSIKSIICTSSLQLGIDIGTIDLVIQYMSPRRVEQLVQRVGRAGHGMDRVSKGIVIATDVDDCFEASVIARRALAGEMDPQTKPTNSLDVLGHQIVGLTLEYWRMNPQDAYNIIREAAPYKTLPYADFLSVCKQLQQLGLVFMDDTVRKKRRGFQYYFGNLSTIPDVKQYKIFNTLEQAPVGVLDEEFVAIHGDVGTSFIVKGEPWRIVSVEEDRVLVEPSDDVEAAVPGWEGELMPVPSSVAQEVGRLRGQIAQRLETMGNPEVANFLQKEYPIDRNTANKMLRLVRKQMKYGFVPTDDQILIEDFENLAIIHTCFGSVINETLGRFLAAMLTARVGSVGLKTDPYRIMIQFQQLNIPVLKEALKTPAEHLRTYLEMALTKSELFEWKFVHVAKRFGAIARDVSLGRTRMKRIIDDYVGTPIFKETLQELENQKLNIDGATEILEQIQTGKIKVVYLSGLSPIGRVGVKHKYAEVIGPEKPEREIFQLFKSRILGTKKKLICLNCGEWWQTYKIEEMPDDVKCEKCEARLLAIVHPKSELQKMVQKKLKRRQLSTDEQMRWERMRASAELFLVYNKRAALCVAGRGVGTETAKRILAKMYKDEDSFFRAILEAERMYIKTKKYWKL